MPNRFEITNVSSVKAGSACPCGNIFTHPKGVLQTGSACYFFCFAKNAANGLYVS